MTRPLAAGQRFVAALPDHLLARIEVIETPLLRVEPTGAAAELGPSDAAVFTSANGVRWAQDGAGRIAFCVGPATTQAARDCGWAASQCGETADELAQTLAANPPEQRLFHLSGTHTRGDIVTRLSKAGADITRVALYDQARCDLTDAARDALDGDRHVLIPLFSPRTATQFFAQAPRLDRAVLLALSHAVADCAPASIRGAVIVSAAPNASAMAKALEDTADRLAAG
ncbi:uroporphyrinogen-III synthase [uncultured Tateyamaria sp.]|uniref:uroporphyrinogen-III synthase n=1 Tax=Tateyamaria sp. 1078 TaxID=3417464 RepID=UPI00261872BF|nr:uroporphyrinogen-III synthase [uncultured Tateyamaria sp.]